MSLRTKTAQALSEGDYERFSKLVTSVFDVEVCEKDHTLYHSILRSENGSNGGRYLSMPEYVHRLERILTDGLRDSGKRDHVISDREIPAVYFSADNYDKYHGMGPLFITTHSSQLEIPVFRDIADEFAELPCGQVDHVAYSMGNVSPKEPFSVFLDVNYNSNFKDRFYGEIMNELSKRKISPTVFF